MSIHSAGSERNESRCHGCVGGKLRALVPFHLVMFLNPERQYKLEVCFIDSDLTRSKSEVPISGSISNSRGFFAICL